MRLLSEMTVVLNAEHATQVRTLFPKAFQRQRYDAQSQLAIALENVTLIFHPLSVITFLGAFSGPNKRVIHSPLPCALAPVVHGDASLSDRRHLTISYLSYVRLGKDSRDDIIKLATAAK